MTEPLIELECVKQLKRIADSQEKIAEALGKLAACVQQRSPLHHPFFNVNDR